MEDSELLASLSRFVIILLTIHFSVLTCVSQDCIVLSMIPPDPNKSPFAELRCVVPIRMTTDPWNAEGTGAPFIVSEYSTPSTPDESRAASHFSDYQDPM